MEGEAGQGFIPADKGRDMTPVGEETDYKGGDRGGGAEMEEEERQREARGWWWGWGSINWFQELICAKVRYSLGTCHPSQMRGPVEGRLITMAADGGKWQGFFFSRGPG